MQAQNGGPGSEWSQPPTIPENSPLVKTVSSTSASRRTTDSRSQHTSPHGSPPMPSNRPAMTPNQLSQTSVNGRPTAYRPTQGTTSQPNQQPLSPYQASYTRGHRPTGTRKESMGGGMQVVLGETGSWSDLAKNDTTLPADAKLEVATKPSGMLSFLGRKKGRGHSPKPQERGILGKEGARKIVGDY